MLTTCKKLIVIVFISILGCKSEVSNDDTESEEEQIEVTEPLTPIYVTDTVNFDSDDPAIWLNKSDLTQSMILGTDKIEEQGGIFMFDLKGNKVKSVEGIDRPNNVDIAYNFVLGKDTVDIAVCTERGTSEIRVLRLPELEFIDSGGISVFSESEFKQPMGVALYTRASDQKIYAIVSRKENPPNNNDYLWQYELNGLEGVANGTLVRKFGKYEGNEVEAIAVDNEMGFVYYSDEGFGVRKYYADPALDNNEELAVFGKEGFIDDHEGISIYKSDAESGYIIVSDQGANEFHFFPREGSNFDPHNHPLIKAIAFSTLDSDGSEVTHLALNSDFPKGMFVAMSNDKTFQIYSWADIQSFLQ